MIHAFVLIHVESGKEKIISEKFKKIKIIKEIFLVDGEYEIILRVEATDTHILKKIVANQIEKIDGVISTAISNISNVT